MGEIEAIWTKTLEIMEQRISGPSFETWLKDTEALNMSNDRLVVSVPTDFVREWLENRYSQLICDVLVEVTGRRLQLVFVVKTATSMDQINQRDEVSSAQLNPKYTFESFVIGNSNRFAHAAALAVAEAPAKAYNPLFIYGGVGLYKAFHNIYLISSGSLYGPVKSAYYALGDAALKIQPQGVAYSGRIGAKLYGVGISQLGS